MNAESILSTGIANIDTVYGGVRGTTLSSRHNLRHWQTIAESGIRTVIELRNEDHSERLCRLCKEYDIYYFPFPLDSLHTSHLLAMCLIEATLTLIGSSPLNSRELPLLYERSLGQAIPLKHERIGLKERTMYCGTKPFASMARGTKPFASMARGTK